MTVLPIQQTSPDNNALGFLQDRVNPLRYDGQSDDPDEVAAVLASLIPRSARILDVGCGTGSVTTIVSNICSGIVVGIEPDADRAALAALRGVDVHVGLFTEPLLSEIGKFDVIMFADVLEHLAEPISILKLAKLFLNPGGCVVASVPNVAHWSVRLNLLRGKFQYANCGIMDATHLRWFTNDTLQLLFRSAGMQIEASRMTAGFDLDVYINSRPWCEISHWHRKKIIRFGLRRWKFLFGCQHVARAVPL